MLQNRITIQFCGFGGQGIILSSVIFGTTAVTRIGLQAVQTQSYGSEARGGECQAELILSPQPINSPLSDQVEILIAMSQPALNQYIRRLKPGGTLIIDPDLVTSPLRQDICIIPLPATQAANELGMKIVANMFVLGFLQQATGLCSAENLCEVILENVPSRFAEINIKAARQGMEFARQQDYRVEV